MSVIYLVFTMCRHFALPALSSQLNLIREVRRLVLGHTANKQKTKLIFFSFVLACYLYKGLSLGYFHPCIQHTLVKFSPSLLSLYSPFFLLKTVSTEFLVLFSSVGTKYFNHIHPSFTLSFCLLAPSGIHPPNRTSFTSLLSILKY
jgi:hypothetical protein